MMTLKALYQLSTADLATHQRTIAAHFARLDARRQRVIRRRLEGATLREIGAELRISVGSVQSLIDRSMEAIRKAAAHEPRYNSAAKLAR